MGEERRRVQSHCCHAPVEDRVQQALRLRPPYYYPSGLGGNEGEVPVRTVLAAVASWGDGKFGPHRWRHCCCLQEKGAEGAPGRTEGGRVRVADG